MRVCIVCQKDVDGKVAYAVKEDTIIRTIRAVKQFFHIAQNNELYVCEDDKPAHEKKRKEFERSLILFGVLAAVVVLVLVGTLLLSGRFDPVAFASAILIGLFILLFAVVFKYAPAIEASPGEPRVGRPAVPGEIEELEEEEKSGKPPARKPAGKKR